MYLVAGGDTTQYYPYDTTDTTELLIHGASSWTYTGRLPRALRKLLAVSMNNQVISIGEIIFRQLIIFMWLIVTLYRRLHITSIC